MKKGNSTSPCFTSENKSDEFYRLTFHQSDYGVWLGLLDKPLSTSLPLDQQEIHLFKYAFLAECNLSFVKMYGYDDPGKLIGARFTQLFDNAVASNLLNLRAFLKNGYQVRNTETLEIGAGGIRKYFLNDVFGIVEEGLLIRVWGMQKDITSERLEQEENLKIIQQLTPRERAIIKHTIDGKSLKEIGDAIDVNPKTVDSLRSRIKVKLGVTSLSQLIALAFQLGMQDIEI